MEETNKANFKLMVVNSTKPLNVRSGPGLQFDIIKKLKPGRTVKCFEVSEEWARLDNGYCMKEFLKDK